jgi:hypothetical protein
VTPPETPPLPPLPPLPDRVEPETLRDLDDARLQAILAEITAAERATVAAMAPHERQLRELRARAAEVATEARRRERADHVARRRAVREQAASGEMPSLADVLAGPEPVVPEERALTAVSAFLRTGGQVGFGFPTRPGVMAFTDGRRSRQATTVGEARQLFADGWEPGAAGLPGVRVHLAGTRVERVVSAEDVVVAADSAGGEAAESPASPT